MAKPKKQNVSFEERERLDKDNRRKKIDYLAFSEKRKEYQRRYRIKKKAEDLQEKS